MACGSRYTPRQAEGVILLRPEGPLRSSPPVSLDVQPRGWRSPWRCRRLQSPELGVAGRRAAAGAPTQPLATAVGFLSLSCAVQARHWRRRRGRARLRDLAARAVSMHIPEMEGQQFTDSELRRVFQKFDKNQNGSVSPKEFLDICMQELHLSLTEVEVRRLFANLDTNQSGEISFAKFRHGIRRNSLLRAVAVNYHVKVDPILPEDYDYSVPTYVAHRHPDFVAETPQGTSSCKEYDPAKHGAVYGEFANIRGMLDYNWHTNYSRERQEWQDQVVRRVAQCTKPQNRPWVIFTCGAMGSGKGWVMSWLSRHNIFPLEHIVHIDPDYFKGLMPEWKGYIAADSEEAGTMCHKESGALQELCQQVAMRGSQNIWIDGSLGDHRWYTKVFERIRKNFQKYRIALIYVYCDPGQLHQRIKKRGRLTGRIVPERKLQDSIRRTREAVDVLSPLTDFAAKIDNRGGVPWLEMCQDRSHSFVTLRNQFRLGKEPKAFPQALGDVSVKRHVLLSEQLDLPAATREALCGGSQELQRIPLLKACRPRLKARLEAEIKSRLDLLDGPVFLCLSPAAEVLLDRHSRARADVPEDARFCCMCHGCTSQGWPVKILPDFEKGTGAFVYLDADGEVVGVNVMSRQPAQEAQFFVKTSKPVGLPADLDWKMELADRWARSVTPPKALRAAEAVAWLLPGELPECPFGGFAYRLYEGQELAFPIVASE